MAMAVSNQPAPWVVAPVSSTALQPHSSSRQLRLPAPLSQVRRRSVALHVVAAAEDEQKESRGIFSFVTDNESSRSAIQMPNTPAQDGNLGQMISEIEDKGRDFGSSIRAGEFRWFVRETGSPTAPKGTVLLLHGSPTQSYSYRVVMTQLAEKGYHCYAPDWLGYGFSERPQPDYDFAYTEEAYHAELDKLLARLNVTSPFFLVVQGFIVGSYGLTWALKNPSRVSKIGILNSPLTSAAPLPNIFKQLRLPLVGEFTCQNAVLAERFVEGGSPYVLELDDADVYRLPYLDSSDPGFSLLASSRKAPVKDLTARISQGFSKPWNIPVIIPWGIADKYLPVSEADNFAKQNPEVIKVSLLEAAGHLPQEDWPEKVVDSLTRFF